jgi:hypothetical protein
MNRTPAHAMGCGGTAGSSHLAKRFTAPGVAGWHAIRKEVLKMALKSILSDKSLSFATRIVKLYR